MSGAGKNSSRYESHHGLCTGVHICQRARRSVGDLDILQRQVASVGAQLLGFGAELIAPEFADDDLEPAPCLLWISTRPVRSETRTWRALTVRSAAAVCLDINGFSAPVSCSRGSRPQPASNSISDCTRAKCNRPADAIAENRRQAEIVALRRLPIGRTTAEQRHKADDMMPWHRAVCRSIAHGTLRVGLVGSYRYSSR
jgi:hypothetical protein